MDSKEQIVYKPEWDMDTETYNDICPFEPKQPGPIYICNCRNKADTFQNMTKYKLHIKSKYHTDWVKNYGKQNMPIENKIIVKEYVKKNKNINDISAVKDDNITNKLERLKL